MPLAVSVVGGGQIEATGNCRGGALVSVDVSGGRLPGVSEYAISYGGEYRIAAPGSTGLIVGQPGDPRTYGVTMKARF